MDIIEIENNHTMNIDKNNMYMNIVEMIIGDVLMGKIKKLEDGSLQLINMTDTVDSLIENWYVMADELKKYNQSAFSVYRGVSNMEDNDIIFQPIPFSTCVEFDNALNWIYDDKSFIMKINLKIEDLYTFTGNILEGREVIIGGCNLKKISSTKKNGVVINEYNII